jgi:hypothetical protein
MDFCDNENVFFLTLVQYLSYVKGTVSRDFLLLVFFLNQFPPSPRVFQPVSATPAANFATSFASVVDTGGKFATGVNDTGGSKFAAGINDTGGKTVSMTPVANNGSNIRLLRP